MSAAVKLAIPWLEDILLPSFTLQPHLSKWLVSFDEFHGKLFALPLVRKSERVNLKIV
jgi:hypothetical protein